MIQKDLIVLKETAKGGSTTGLAIVAEVMSGQEVPLKELRKSRGAKTLDAVPKALTLPIGVC